MKYIKEKENNNRENCGDSKDLHRIKIDPRKGVALDETKR